MYKFDKDLWESFGKTIKKNVEKTLIPNIINYVVIFLISFFILPKSRMEINLSYSRKTFTKTVKKGAVLRTLSFNLVTELCIS